MKLILLMLILSVSAFSKSFIWEVSDGDSKLYLLGSVHIASEEMYPLAPEIENAYSESEGVALEIVLDQVNPFEMMGMMMLQGNQNLKDVMDSVEYTNIKKMFDELGVPEMSYIKLKPWAATLVLMQQEMARTDFKQDLGFDYYFMNKARKDSLEVIGLETVKEQLSAFEELSNLNSDFLKYSIEELNNSTKMINEMLEAWEQGDTNKINEIINMPSEKTENYEKVTEILLDRRNFKMQEKIEGFLKDNKKYFVVVGAGHLVGENGLLTLLKNKKYKLKQL